MGGNFTVISIFDPTDLVTAYCDAKRTTTQTHSRKYSSSAEPRRAVGKYHDYTDYKDKVCRFNVGVGDEAEKRLAALQYIYENRGRGDNGLWRDGLLKVAQQIAAGETPTRWTAATNPEDYARKVLSNQEYFPALKLVEPDPRLMADSIGANRKYIDESTEKLRLELEATHALQTAGKKLPARISKHNLKATLAAYKKDRVET
jgi:hypothetical protein